MGLFCSTWALAAAGPAPLRPPFGPGSHEAVPTAPGQGGACWGCPSPWLRPTEEARREAAGEGDPPPGSTAAQALPLTPARSVNAPGLRSVPPWDSEAKTTGRSGRPLCWLRDSRAHCVAHRPANPGTPSETHKNKNDATSSEGARAGHGACLPSAGRGGVELASPFRRWKTRGQAPVPGTPLVKHRGWDFNSHRPDSGTQGLAESTVRGV